MNDKFTLPLYFQPNRRWSKLNIYDIKWLILFLLVLSTLAVYVLFVNLPSDLQKQVNLHDLFIPDVHNHEHLQDQQQAEPPIDILNKQKSKAIESTKIVPVVQQKVDKQDENTKRREKVKEVSLISFKKTPIT
jgi:hypothetical protein